MVRRGRDDPGPYADDVQDDDFTPIRLSSHRLMLDASHVRSIGHHWISVAMVLVLTFVALVAWPWY